MKMGSSFNLWLCAATLMSMVKSSVGTGFCVEGRWNTAGEIIDFTPLIDFGSAATSDDVLVSCNIGCSDATLTQYNIQGGNRGDFATNPDCATTPTLNFMAIPLVETTGINGNIPFVTLRGVAGQLEVTLQCTCENREKSDNGGCFSPRTTVQVKGMGDVSLHDLTVGSQILTDVAAQTYETVYAMAHKNLETPTDFLQLFMDSNKKNPLEVTSDHFMYKQGQNSPVRADSLQVGDVMEGGAKLTKIGQITLKGRMTPLTSSGKVVVNGQVQASNYIDYEHGTTLFGTGYTNAMSHLFISPFRLLCTANPSNDYCVKTNEEGIPTGLDFLKGYANSAMESNVFVQGSMLAAFAFVAISAWGVECLFMVPFVAWIAAMAFVVSNKAGQKQKTL